jgi:ATP:cob(I)alamin adenosyltransferase
MAAPLLFTRRGDQGTTRLAAGHEVSKAWPICDFLGASETARTQMGVARTSGVHAELVPWLVKLQQDLVHVDLHVTTLNGVPPNRFDGDTRTAELETEIARLQDQMPVLEPLFCALPGQSAGEAHLFMVRSKLREMERRFWEMPDMYQDAGIGKYLNRVSDYLLVLTQYQLFLTGLAARFATRD